MATSIKSHLGTIKFDRNELSGAFGDIGTDLPLIIGMIVAAGLDSGSVLIIRGKYCIQACLHCYVEAEPGR